MEKKLKKHQLLEKAMRDYPAGTRFKSPLCTYKGTSTGVFNMSRTLHNSVVCICENDYELCVYSSLYDKWAEIIPDKPKSILDGKVAVYCENYRQYFLTHKHFESAGKYSPIIKENYFQGKPIFISNDENPKYWSSLGDITPKESGYTIIPFADFAKEVGIKVPVFVMKSEDGVDLYDGHEYYPVTLFFSDNKWRYIKRTLTININRSAIRKPSYNKAFSTREAAEKWIKEQNKPTPEQIIAENQGYRNWAEMQEGFRLKGIDTQDFLISTLSELITKNEES